MYLKHALGKHGEDLACNYLEKHNYKIIERNFRCKKGEIDIIAKDIIKNELVFIEVKTRSSLYFSRPAQAVNFIKQNHILNTSKYYLYKNRIQNVFIRYDIIEVYIEDYTFKLNHIKQVF